MNRRITLSLSALALVAACLAPGVRAEESDPRVKELAAGFLLEAQSANFRDRAAVTSLARRGDLEVLARQAIEQLAPATGEDPEPDPSHVERARLAASEWARASLSYREELPRGSFSDPKRFVDHVPVLPAAAMPVVRPPKSAGEGTPSHWIVEQPVRTFFTQEGKPYDVFLVRVNAETFLVEGVRGHFRYQSGRTWGSFED